MDNNIKIKETENIQEEDHKEDQSVEEGNQQLKPIQTEQNSKTVANTTEKRSKNRSISPKQA